MSTPTVFTPLVQGLNWTLATTDASGNPLPAGESESGVTIGIRLDGDVTHASGNYQYLVVCPAGSTSFSPAQIAAVLGKPLPPGNYWAAIDQTDTLDGSPATSAWTAEIPFSIPVPVVAPAPPTNFHAA
jgi:hypothetical protein